MRYAVIDLGTNTFNLLIFEPGGDHVFKKIISTKRAVKLGLGTINQNFINPEAMVRGEKAIGNFVNIIRKFKAEKVYTFATSAVRSAVNGNEFKEKIETKFPIKIDVISGEREAELIYKGVSLAVEFKETPYLILDIGGGSNEFIIADDKGIIWKQSFNLGIARLIERFQPSDPIKENEISVIENYLEEELQTMFDAVKTYNVNTLIGSSGSFESIADMLSISNTEKASCIIDLRQYYSLHETLLQSTLEQRRKMQGLLLMRSEMIVLASILTQLVIKKAGIVNLIKADYSLKEGVIAEIINNK